MASPQPNNAQMYGVIKIDEQMNTKMSEKNEPPTDQTHTHKQD